MALRRTKRSISRQLAASILFIVAALVAALSLVVSILLTKNFERQIELEIVRASSAIQQSIYWFMSGAYNLSRELAENEIILTMDGELQTPMLEKTAERNNYIELLFIQGMDGIQTGRSHGPPGGSRRNRFWFVRMLENPDPFVSKSYYSVSTRMPVASIFIPMYRGGEMVGVFGADIKLQFLQQFIERVSDSGEGRYSYIIDGEGVILAHPNSEYIETQVNVKSRTRTVPRKNRTGHTMADSDGNVITAEVPYHISDGYAALVKRAMAGESGVGIAEHDGKIHYVSYSPISMPGNSDSWTVITLQDKDSAMRVMTALIRDIIIIALALAAIAALIFMRFIKKKITKPVYDLTVAAGKISQGELNAEIPSINAGLRDEDEIAVMSVALNRMVEQLRVHAALQAREQAVTAVKLQFALFVKEAASIPQAFKMSAAVLRYKYDPLKITAVYATANKTYALTCVRGGGEEGVTEGSAYQHHAEVTAMLADKRMVFMNAFTIRERNALFADAATQFACLVPLMSKGSRKQTGYIIVECDDRKGLSIVKEENFLLKVADELSEWISKHKRAQLTTHVPAPAATGTDGGVSEADAGVSGDAGAGGGNKGIGGNGQAKAPGALSALREFADLEVDSAIEAMGGLEELYERSVRLFAKLLPDTIAKMDSYLNSDLKAFAVEIHGVKGSLNNIGAALGQRAAWIEKAAKCGDTAYCADSYPRFREQLHDFHNRLLDALPAQPPAAAKPAGNIGALADKLDKVRELATAFDALEAKKAVQEIADFSYSPDADAIIADIASALERFDCENACQLTDKLKGSL